MKFAIIQDSATPTTLIVRQYLMQIHSTTHLAFHQKKDNSIVALKLIKVIKRDRPSIENADSQLNATYFTNQARLPHHPKRGEIPDVKKPRYELLALTHSVIICTICLCLNEILA
ncbi:unnamed protein product [Ilex paraguariensis]|uniref:Uncharacterized protein n=1 Tax=Ilex paraguariensis TaxID=185542 RepID=A0ABC8TY64_9AQUA